MKSSLNKLNKPLLFAWILVVLTLSLILKSGLYSDDIHDFQVRRSMGPLSVTQMIHVTHHDIVDFRRTLGRDTPVVYIEETLIFWLANSVLTYKIFILLINILAVYLFTRLLRSFEMDDWIPFALLIFCATEQFYINYHDAFTSLHAMYPFLTALIFSAIISFVSFLKKGSMVAYSGTLLIVTTIIFFCEVGFVIYPILFLLLIFDKRPILKRVLLFLPFLLLLGAYTFNFIWVRQHADNIYSGVTLNFDRHKMVQTFLIQVFAAIPGSHFIGMYAIPQYLLDQLKLIYPLALICLVSFIGLLISYRNIPLVKLGSRKSLLITGIGLLLLLLPASILMGTVKYQNELEYGKGYLPVYIQNFGFVLLIITLCSLLFSKLGKAASMIKTSFFIVFFIISMATLLLNNNLIDITNYNRANPSIFYYESLKNGILKDCEDGSVIILKTDYFYQSPNFYQMVMSNFYKQSFEVTSEEDFIRKGVEGDRPCYLLEHNYIGQFTLLYKISPNENKLIKRINYPVGKDFSYFDLISTPL